VNNWLRRLRGALGMGLTWAFGGALVGGLVEAIANFVPPLNVVDMWIPVFAIPGFIGGMLFSVVLGIAGRNRRFDELSLPLFAAWGAIPGLLFGCLSFGIDAYYGTWWSALRIALAVGAPALLGAATATATLAIARRAAVLELPGEVTEE
jgi:hypothetical protein